MKEKSTRKLGLDRDRGEYRDEGGRVRVCKACVPGSRATKHTCGTSDLQSLLRF